MKKLYLTGLNRMLLLLLLMAAVSANAQFTISGKVTDDTGMTLIGVNILEKNTSNGTITDFDGNYSLEVSDSNAIVVFSYTGYGEQEISVNGRSTIDLVMEEQAELLNEIVVIGYGTVRKSDLTGSVTTLKADDIQKVASANPLQALQGKAPGVQVTSASGRPGEAPIIRIRGTGTLNGAGPIYVVDGLIVDDISFLNSADIERVEVLKDASAAAIYGTRAANGVILVTTKKGVQSENARIRFSSYVGSQRLDRQINLTSASEYATLVNEIAMNNGGNPPFDNPETLGQGTNWQDAIFQSGLMQNYNLNISGGSENVTYSVSGDFFRQEGIIKSSYYDRYSLRVNNEYKLFDWWKIGHNVAFVHTSSNNEPGSIVFNAIAADPTVPIVDSNGVYGNTSTNSNVSNPVAQLEYNSYNRRYPTQLAGNVYTDFFIAKGLKFRTSGGFFLSNTREKDFTPEFEVNDRQRNPESVLTIRQKRLYDWQIENTLNYEKEWSNHRINLLGGFSAQEKFEEIFEGSRKRLIGDSEDFLYLDAGDSETSTNSGRVEDFRRYLSYLFRANYVFKDRYLATVTFRRDGSSIFGIENRYGNFPSFALGWRLIEEPFLQNQNFLANLKLRASWGKLGNDKIPYKSASPTVTNNLNAVFGPDEGFLFGATLNSLANPFLQWEESISSDAGIEIGFLNNRLNAELDYYHRKTNKILVAVPVPDYVGSASNPYINAAEVLNTGFDWNVNYSDRAGHFNYSFGFNGSTNHNEVLSLGSDREAIRDLSVNGEFATSTQVGLPIGAFYGYKVAGVYQNQADIDAYPNAQSVRPGDLRFEDTNGDGIIDPEDRTYLGSPIPTLVYGFNAGFEFKGVDFSINFSGVSGNKIINTKRMQRGFGYPNFETFFLDRWTGEGSTEDAPRATNGGIPNFQISDRFIEDGSFLRLRSIQLGYNLNSNFLNRVKVTSFRIYVSANNLATWTNYSGFSPELSSNDVTKVGEDSGVYPVAQTFLIGLNVGF